MIAYIETKYIEKNTAIEPVILKSKEFDVRTITNSNAIKMGIKAINPHFLPLAIRLQRCFLSKLR